MAEAILKQMSHGDIEVVSAGTVPEDDIHPMARQALASLGISLAGQYPKSLHHFADRHFDYVITVCDRAAERCPVFPGDPERIHWSFDDPASATGTIEQRQRAFSLVASQLVNRMRIWLSLPSVGGTIRR